MFRPFFLVALAILTFSTVGGSQPPQKPKWAPSPHIAATPPRTPEEQRKEMTVPPGLELQLVAADPDITMPINIACDARGRVWVTLSQEYPFPAPQGKKTRDTVKILDDFGPDGRARKITTFAEDLNIPIGVLPYGKGAIIYSIPNVWYLEDTDDDGKADKKTILLSQYGFKDTHGMTGEFALGFDGWVYACHGFANRSTLRGRDGSTITMESGNTYRFKPDGTRLEHYTFGQVNPFGLAFDPLGNLFSVDCHTRPIYQLLRGGTYPHFGRPAPGLGFAPAMMTHIHGSTANAGIAYYAAEDYPPAFRNNIFTGNVITNRVNRDRLERHGSSYRAIEMPDLIASKDPWFRPVDIKLGLDGALYVADFYTRIIGHYEMPLTHPARTKEYGRIWRVVQRGQGGPEKVPDLTSGNVEALVAALEHANLTRRLQAANELVQRRVDAKVFPSELRKKARSWAHVLWILERLGQLDERTLADATQAESPLVRVHALRILADRREPGATLQQLALARVKDEDALVRRNAAEVLGLHPHPNHIRPLLELCLAVPKDDTHLLYAGRLALRNQLKPAAWNKLNELQLNPVEIQMLAGVVIDLPTTEAATFLAAHLGTIASTPEDLRRYSLHIARHGSPMALEKVATFGHQNLKDRFDEQAVLLKSLIQASQEKGTSTQKLLPWASAVSTKLLATAETRQVLAGIDLASSFRLAGVASQLEQLLGDAKRPEDVRRAAASALLSLDGKQYLGSLSRRLQDPQETAGLREHLAGVLGGTNSSAARAELIKALVAAPARLQAALALALASSKQGAEELLNAVAAGKASPRLLREPPVEQKLKQANPPKLTERLGSLTRGLPATDVRVQQLIRERTLSFARAGGNAALGRKVFEKNCAICHQIANQGAKFAPQLDGVGLRGPERLLEDILDPGRNVDQAFRATLLEFRNGKIVSGLLVRQEGKILVLVDPQGKEQRYSRDDLDSVASSSLSPMPAGLEQQLTESDLHHLLAFLLQQSQKERSE